MSKIQYMSVMKHIAKLEEELKAEVLQIEKEGKQVIVKYDKKTNKDELYLEEVQP